jgi:FKBP-type peptidyl-prolyl cis-trans isomerase FkpA
MNVKFPLVAAFVAMLSLSGCGGGSGGGSTGGTSCNVSITVDPALKISDSSIGTGATASACSKVTVNYTGWLYDATKVDHKGVQFDSGSFAFTLGVGQVIPGFDQAVYNMKVGGTRTVEIPSRLGYGVSGSPPKIPGNTDLVFTITLTAVQ